MIIKDAITVIHVKDTGDLDQYGGNEKWLDCRYILKERANRIPWWTGHEV